MKKIYQIMLLLGITLGLGLSGGALAASKPVNGASCPCVANQKKGSVLTVISARNAIFSKENGHWKLVLASTTPDVLWFADRPVRKAGTLVLSELIRKWNQVFRGDSPNAAFAHAEIASDRNGGAPFAVELSNPILSKGVLTFNATALPGSKIRSGTYKNPRIFIDDALSSVLAGVATCISGFG